MKGAFLALALLSAAPAAAQLTLRVTVPAGTPADSVFVAGSFNGWNPGNPAYRLARQDDGSFALTVPEVQGGVEFKLALGSWERGETTAAGADAPNRGFRVPAGGGTYTGEVAGWRDGKPRPAGPSTARPTVSILADSFPIPQLGRTRRVWLYLPPDYATSGRRYPVLYMHDGQNVFDASASFSGEWGVDETLDSLAVLGDPGVIVVAVDNGGTHRLDEYSPWRNARYGGGEGDAYLDFLVRDLKPYVDSRLRTLPDRRHTAIAGSSMGGLISLYAVMKYPEVFGRAGVFSPALWFAPEVFARARASAPQGIDPRVYLVTGAREGDEPEVYSGDHRRMLDTLAAAGWARGRELEGFVREDGTHSEWFWRREFPAVYRWLFAER